MKEGTEDLVVYEEETGMIPIFSLYLYKRRELYNGYSDFKE